MLLDAERIEKMRKQLSVNSNTSLQDIDSIQTIQLLGQGSFGKVCGATHMPTYIARRSHHVTAACGLLESVLANLAVCCNQSTAQGSLLVSSLQHCHLCPAAVCAEAVIMQTLHQLSQSSDACSMCCIGQEHQTIVDRRPAVVMHAAGVQGALAWDGCGGKY